MREKTTLPSKPLTQQVKPKLKLAPIIIRGFRYSNRKYSESIPCLSSLDIVPLNCNAIFHNFRDSLKERNIAGEFRFKANCDRERMKDYVREIGVDLIVCK